MTVFQGPFSTKTHQYYHKRVLGKKKLLRDGEIDNCWVLFHKEVVLGESFDAKDEVRRQFGELEPFQEILFVGFVFLSVNQTKHNTIFSLLLIKNW